MNLPPIPIHIDLMESFLLHHPNKRKKNTNYSNQNIARGAIEKKWGGELIHHSFYSTEFASA